MSRLLVHRIRPKIFSHHLVNESIIFFLILSGLYWGHIGFYGDNGKEDGNY